MIKIRNNVEKSIITIDPYKKDAFKFIGNEVGALDVSRSISKENFFISYLKFKNLITTTISISRETSEEELSNIISIKTYEELSLDATIDYKIVFIESQAQTEDRLFSVFVIADDTIDKIFKDIMAKIPYIDYLSIAPLLYSSLYKKGFLTVLDVDCFICLQKDDAFLAVYSGGEYLTSRPLRYNLSSIKDRYSEPKGERISEEAFYEKLNTNGICMDTESENFDPELNDVLEDCFFYINDAINIINRVYFVNIHNIFIDSEIGKIPGLENFVQNKIGLKTATLSTNISINSKDYDLSQQHNMMALIARLTKEEDYQAEFNFSSFLRPQPFTKRTSGKFILSCGAASLLAVAYPAYNYLGGYYLEQSIPALTQELIDLKNESNRIRISLAGLQKEKEQMQDMLVKDRQKLEFRENLLTQISDKKNEYAMKGINIFEISQIINQNKVKVSNIFGKDRNMTFVVQSNDEKNITELIKQIAQTAKYSINTKRIDFNKAQNVYESNVSVEIR
ncbi:C4-dicarboxylate ABC transporter [Campylobacter sp. RM13119]|uniref:C4-dicarboxylate ABC transporter n=1 Tax=Campylobacter californiensis TaxID=1032243 RepID=UPI0014730A92|nr:C4-dicarboxylate ABC transporter [Campylobacter sp. RM13119]MBE3605520.1 C4-dicarboxylate ABC transporter [Campylobacter sp. RM13119]